MKKLLVYRILLWLLVGCSLSMGFALKQTQKRAQEAAIAKNERIGALMVENSTLHLQIGMLEEPTSKVRAYNKLSPKERSEAMRLIRYWDSQPYIASGPAGMLPRQ